MSDATFQKMRKHVRDSEGSVPRPYKDTKGKLTIGTGFLVDDEHSFAALRLQVRDVKTGQLRDATDTEKRAEFNRIKPMTKEQLQQDRDAFKIPDSENDRKLDTEITTRVDKVKKEIGEADWNKLTDGQKTAVVDIHYANGSLEKFPSLKKAIKNGDAKAMAEQSDFHGGKMDGTNYYHRNFDRIRRNRAEMQGIDPESPEAHRAVADKYPGHPSLNDKYKRHATPGGSTPQPEKSGQRPQAPTAGGGTTIQPGDTLSKIAARHGVSAEELAKANGFTDPNRIRAGQSLTIPGQPPRGPSSEEIERRILEGRVPPVAGSTALPLPTRSEWPKVDPSAFPAPTDNTKAEGPAKPDHAGTSPEPPADPQVAAMVEMAGTPIDNPGRAALLKPVESLTEGEMKDMIASAQTDYRGWQAGDPLKAHSYERVQDWHVANFGDGEQRTDGGKPVEPTPIRAIPEQPSPHTTPQGEDLWQAAARIGQRIADAAGSDGYADAVKGLQRGLNILGEARPSPAYGAYTKLGPVDEDGRYGPQTDFALKHAVSRFGAPKVDEAMALGRFNTFARNAAQSSKADGLEAATHSIFGPLFRGPKDGDGTKIEAGLLQETLNDLGPRHHDDWAPLKVDNWIGPKTTDAFGRVLKAEAPDELTRRFGQRINL